MSMHIVCQFILDVDELMTFLGKFPNILQDLPKRKRITLLRTKIFNERKLAREKVRRTVQRGKLMTKITKFVVQFGIESLKLYVL